MPTLQELKSQRDALNSEIDVARQRERAEAIPRLRSLVTEFGITAKEIFGNAGARTPKLKRDGTPRAARTSANGLAKGTPKYRDPATGKTWSGYGRNPAWFSAENAKSLEIASQ